MTAPQSIAASAVGALALVLLGGYTTADAQSRGGTANGAAPQTAQTLAPIDLTGYWVALISEDWRWRMVTPAKGDYASVPLTPEGLKTADTWDPARDEASGEQCRSYGAPGLMRAPTRLHISWQDTSTLKVDTDYGMQTRLLHFGDGKAPKGPATWQGDSAAQLDTARGRSQDGRRAGSLRVVTTHLRPGYLRKNGVPYSADTLLTEYWDKTIGPNNDQWIVITSVVRDSLYLQVPFTTALHFKKEGDGAKWDPTPCSARW